MSINCLKLNCFFVSISIILCSHSLLFDLLDLLASGIQLSTGDTYYLDLSSVAHDKILQIYSGKAMCKEIHLNNKLCVGEIFIVTNIYTRKLFDKLSDQL